VQDAKARLSELLRLARSGKPQHIGLSGGCVLISEETWSAVDGAKLGEWLVASAPQGNPIEIPPRSSKRGDPFHNHKRTHRG
jgi:hypothetical protein